ncbi:MAG: dynamin family protein [Bacteroidales bacterium]|nr:dynamin family protein [Bacteroidales bacterium]
MVENYEQEKTEYIRRLTVQIETIDKILNTNTLDLINSEREEKLRKLKVEAERYKQKLEKNEFEIAIVGLEKAGKSTFANAMMGYDILPSDEKRCTYTSTKIKSGSNSGNVKFFTRDEFNSNFRENLRTMEIENADSYSFESLDLTSYGKMYDKLDEKTKKAYGDNINEDVKTILENKNTINSYLGHPDMTFDSSNITTNDFKRFIKAPEYALAVREVSILSSELSGMPNAVIYDVPGFDSPTQIHKEQTVEFMRKADAIVLVAFAPKPSFTGPVVEMFRNNSDFDGVSFGEKMFVFANAADGAENLEENLAEIKKDLQKYNMMKSNFHRIVPGSAAAHLINAGKMEPNKHTKSAVGYKEDGIQKIKDLLEHYNQTERFEILKRRINQKQNEIYDVFNDLFNENKVSPSMGYLQNYGKLLNRINAKKDSIVEQLEAYLMNLIADYDAEKKISKEVKEVVEKEICLENFKVLQDELDKSHSKFPDTDNVVHTTQIDVDLRKTKSKTIYKKFSDIIVALAQEHHNTFVQDVKRIFLTNLSIAAGSEGEKVVDQILENQKVVNTSADNGYYKSLIERFAKDLFEILMETPFTSMDRWQRFEKGYANFSSLAMYDDRKSKSKSGNNQPLFYALLFQQTDKYDKTAIINNILDTIQNVLQFVPAPPVVKLVENAVFLGKKIDFDSIIKSVGNILNRPNANMTQEQKDKQKEQAEINLLNQLKQKIGASTFAEEDLTESSYDAFFKGKRTKDLPKVQQEIEKDIDILHDALSKVVVNAINIEKAFLAFERGNTENLLDFLNDNEAWPNFVNNNIQVINAAEYNNLEAEQERQMSRQNILKDIKNLLDQMNNTSTTNTDN